MGASLPGASGELGPRSRAEKRARVVEVVVAREGGVKIRRLDRVGVAGSWVTGVLTEWESPDEEGVKAKVKPLVFGGEKPKEAAVGGVGGALNVNPVSLGGEKSKVEEGTAAGRVGVWERGGLNEKDKVGLSSSASGVVLAICVIVDAVRPGSNNDFETAKNERQRQIARDI